MKFGFNILADLDLDIQQKETITFQIVDLEIYSILIFYIKVWN